MTDKKTATKSVDAAHLPREVKAKIVPMRLHDADAENCLTKAAKASKLTLSNGCATRYAAAQG